MALLCYCFGFSTALCVALKLRRKAAEKKRSDARVVPDDSYEATDALQASAPEHATSAAAAEAAALEESEAERELQEVLDAPGMP